MTNNFIKYYRLNIKRSFKTMMVLLIILTIIYILPIMRLKENYYNHSMINSTRIGYLITTLGIMAYVSPVKQASYLMNKKSLDNCYGLPISRRNIMLVKILTGVTETIIPFTIVYLLGAILLKTQYNYLKIGYMVPLYFILIIIFLSLYIYNFFFVSRANKIFDGVVFMLFATFALYGVLSIFLFSNSILISNISDTVKFLPFYSLIYYGSYFSDLILPHSIDVTVNMNFSWIIINLIMGSIAAVLLWILIKKDQPERAEEISNSYFGYKVMNPLYIFIFFCPSLLYSFQGGYFVIWTGVGLILYLILTIIYKRSFKISLKDMIPFGIAYVLAIVVAVIIALPARANYRYASLLLKFIFTFLKI